MHPGMHAMRTPDRRQLLGSTVVLCVFSGSSCWRAVQEAPGVRHTRALTATGARVLRPH